MNGLKPKLKKLWYFIWEDNSVWSWIVNIILAFILIKFIVYPGLGFLLQTSHPVVAVVSESMEHNANFDNWWEQANARYVLRDHVVDKWYISNGITKEDFSRFSLKNGFNRGDIMVLKGKKPEAIEVGDVIVFWSSKNDPIIHRVVKKWQEAGLYYFQTKGDNNKESLTGPIVDETRISEKSIVGIAVLRIPLLGYTKIWAVELVWDPLIKPLIGRIAQKG